MFTNPKHVCRIINTTTPALLGRLLIPYVMRRGSPGIHFNSWIISASPPLPWFCFGSAYSQGNVYPNCSWWQQVHDGALNAKVQPAWLRGKMRRVGGVRRSAYCNPESVYTGSDWFLSLLSSPRLYSSYDLAFSPDHFISNLHIFFRSLRSPYFTNTDSRALDSQWKKKRIITKEDLLRQNVTK